MFHCETDEGKDGNLIELMYVSSMWFFFLFVEISYMRNKVASIPFMVQNKKNVGIIHIWPLVKDNLMSFNQFFFYTFEGSKFEINSFKTWTMAVT